MQRCCRAVIERTLRETDTPEEVHRKALWMPIMMVTLTPMPLYLLLRYHLFPQAGFTSNVLNFTALLIGTFYPILSRSLPLALVGTVSCALTIGVIGLDVSAAAAMLPSRPWTWVVLIMDMCLALNVSSDFQRFILCITCVWTVTYTVENCFRLGLYDIEQFSKPEGYPACDCSAPPCSSGVVGLKDIIPFLTVLCGDYFATRGFASGLRDEQTKVQASVDVAEQVAGSLAGFDLEAAESVMRQAGEGLPPPLASSFRRLLRNLARYRPYLPQSCFEDVDASEGGSEEPSNAESDTNSAWSQGCARSRRSGDGSAGPAAGPVKRPSVRASFLELRQRFAQRKGSIVSAASTGSGSLSARRSEAHEAPLPRRGGHAPQTRRVTLLACNRTGFLAAPQLDAESVGAWLLDAVEDFTSAVKRQGGVSDLISGDHFSATFGAVKAQGSQRIAATRAGACFTGAGRPQTLTGAVCSGRALCGDFGSSACQRFMVIGGVSAFLPAAERAAAAWGISTLIDSDVQSDADQFWSSRLRKLVRFPKQGPKPIGLWELLEERLGSGPADEWMYELENAHANPWEPYNIVVAKWCDGDADATLPAVAKALDGVDASGSAAEVVAALHAVREHVQKGAPPPVGDFDAAAFAGGAAPLARLGHAFT